MNLDHAKTFNKDLVLQWFLHHMPMDQRQKLMNALPEAYNDLCGREIVTVVHTEDLPAAVPVIVRPKCASSPS